MIPFVLEAIGTLYKHPKSPTMYLTIPSKVVEDSAFVFKPGEQVAINYDPVNKRITIEAVPPQPSSKGKKSS